MLFENPGASERLNHLGVEAFDSVEVSAAAVSPETEIQGLSRAEAAKRLGLSYSGLKSRVQRGSPN